MAAILDGHSPLLVLDALTKRMQEFVAELGDPNSKQEVRAIFGDEKESKPLMPLVTAESNDQAKGLAVAAAR